MLEAFLPRLFEEVVEPCFPSPCDKGINSVTESLDMNCLMGDFDVPEIPVPHSSSEDMPSTAPSESCDAVQECVICFEPLNEETEVVNLSCSHSFHCECLVAQIESKWPAGRISFEFINCPLCRTRITHPKLDSLIIPFIELEKKLIHKAEDRAIWEQKNDEKFLADVASGMSVGEAALKAYCYYECFKCHEPYFGGNYACGEAPVVKEEELVCPRCSRPDDVTNCPIHGKRFIEWKCNHCCSRAVWYCYGTTHFCDKCHESEGSFDDASCPAGPCGTQLEGECPLGVPHPPSGTEFCLGCALCMNLGFASHFDESLLEIEDDDGDY